MKARRFDIGSLGAVERMPNGWLKVPGRFTRTGVFTYRNPDGSLRRELRLPEEVFHPESMRSFAMVPYTNEHPPVMLDATNAKEYTRGWTGESIVRDGDHLAGTVLIVDGDTIAEVETEKPELSCGYTCDIEESAGVWQGLPYDCIQRNIRGNHLAGVKKGRAGPTARLQLDRFDAEQVVSSTERNDTAMKKILIDGVWYEVSEQVAQAYEKEQAQQKARLDAKEKELSDLKADKEKTQAKLDTALEDLAKEKKLRADAEDPEKVKAKIKARVALESSAQKVLGKEVKLDGLSDQEIKTKVVEKAYPSAQLKDKSADYIQARFDTVIEKASEEHTDEADENPNAVARQTITPVRTDAAPPGDPEGVRQKTIKEESERWKKQLKG